MQKQLIFMLFFPLTGICQQRAHIETLIPLELTSYLPEYLRYTATGLRPAALSGIRQKRFAVAASNKYGIKDAGLLHFTKQVSNDKNGYAFSAGFETSPVHNSIYASMGYGLKLSRSLRIGSSWSMAAHKVGLNKYKFGGEMQIGFLFQLNEKTSWGGHCEQSIHYQTIATGFAYHLSEKLQVSAEIKKESQNKTDVQVMVSNQFHENWLVLAGVRTLSASPFCFVSKKSRHHSWGAGLSFHPLLGASLMLSFTSISL